MITGSLCDICCRQVFGMRLSVFVWVFMLYNFMGWFYESTIFSLGEQGKFMNRGYFIGPWCPIYGCGFFLNMYLLSGINSPVKIFLVSMATCTVVEYITSYVLEKLFNARYWDYSYYPLNINGRVSLISSCFFGITITFMMKVMTPVIVSLINRVNERILAWGSLILFILFMTDIIVTYICMQNLNRKCRQLYDAWNEHVENTLGVLNEKKDQLDRFVIVRAGKKLLISAKNVNATFLRLESRYIRNEGFQSTKYSELVEKVREFYKKK